MDTPAEIVIAFDRLDEAAGLISRERLATAYLAALATASGKTAPTGEPHYEHESDWSDHEYPHHSYSFTWGGDDFGLRALSSRPFEGPGELPTGHAFWVLRGLPGGGTGQGHSSAGDEESPPRAVLKLAGPFDPAPALAAFREALRIDDADPAVRSARKTAAARLRQAAEIVPPPHFPSAVEPEPKVYLRKPQPPWDRDDNAVLKLPPAYRSATRVYERLATHHARLLEPFADPAAPFRWSREEISRLPRREKHRRRPLFDETRTVSCRNGIHVFTFGLYTHRTDEEILWTTVNLSGIKVTRTIDFDLAGTEKPDAPLLELTLHCGLMNDLAAQGLYSALRAILR